MIVYIIMLVVSIVFAELVKYRKKSKYEYIILAIFSMLPFVIVSAIRYDVGTDYLPRYTFDFYNILKGYTVKNYEFGFLMLNKFCISITHDPQLLFVITTLLINIPIFYTIFKYSKNPSVGIFIYFVGAFYFQSMNGIRQYIAMAILLSIYPFFIEKKWIKWGIGVLFAINMHNSCLFFVIVCILLNFISKFNKRKLILNLNIELILLMLILALSSIIKQIVPMILSYTRFDVYIGGKFDYGDIQIIPFMVNLIIYISLYYIYKKKKEKSDIDELDKFFINMQGIAVLCFCLTNMYYLFLRIAYFFSIFQIISIPYFLDYLKKIHYRNTYQKLLLIICTILIISFTWINVIEKVEEVLPYKTVFNKNEIL